MKIERLFDIRFIVPPILTGLLIFVYSPAYFFAQIPESRGAISLIVSSAVILALGFAISSIVDFLITLFNVRTPKGLSELEIWQGMDGESEHLVNQIHKRWNMTIANFNSLAATILAPVILGILIKSGLVSPPLPTDDRLILYFLLVFGLAFIFFSNGFSSHQSTLDMVRQIVDKAKTRGE